ncbi:MAG TPA: hypothetical protein VFA32_01285, partial [Dehalococcoidia bacterium]|nr:hypothetical protein [Dehalococcoidia bacterium]
RKHLVDLFDRCGGYCVFGDWGCQIDEHHYELFIEGIIDSWKAEDRERRNYECKLEQQQILDSTYGRYGTTFDPVARDVFVNSRPSYYLVGLGVNPFTYQRVALVRIPSTFIHLFVDVGTAVQDVSKNARCKALRHGKVRNGALMAKIDELCKLAVEDWWSVKRRCPEPDEG